MGVIHSICCPKSIETQHPEQEAPELSSELSFKNPLMDSENETQISVTTDELENFP